MIRSLVGHSRMLDYVDTHPWPAVLLLGAIVAAGLVIMLVRRSDP